MTPAIDEIRKRRVEWIAVFEPGVSYRANVDGVDYCLWINPDFPDEPFYRLYSGAASTTFDDTPPLWVLPEPPTREPR